jgi:hypothetical protein
MDIYVMIWHVKSLDLKTILRPSIVGGMPLKRTHMVPSLNFKCTPRDVNVLYILLTLQIPSRPKCLFENTHFKTNDIQWYTSTNYPL